MDPSPHISGEIRFPTANHYFVEFLYMEGINNNNIIDVINVIY